MRYSPNWRLTVLAAIFLHFFIWLGAGLALPLLDFRGNPVTIDEMTMVDDYGEENGEEEAEPEKKEEEPPPPEPPVVDIPPEEYTPIEAETTEEAIEKLDQMENKDNPESKGNKPPKQQNMQFGALIVEGYTPDTSGTNFRGRVGFLVDLDENGKMTGYKITKTSNRTVIDTICLNAIRRFKFEPAVDMEGKTMKTKRLIMFEFDGSGPHIFDDRENIKIRTNKELWMREKAAAEKGAKDAKPEE
ncbi:hypothetical protein TAMA11512_18470 [Selenomonas sp. TAMA-11512]|uniref:energy transducer TonB n=1 Tax=Selenomonas sp. TAMA-11512 TaxID=3095337 RepID=UPI0030936495|nr:hypothetical protein TAMA11512_18470 [Selenomonas sp. TAMA-11512]